MLFDFFTIASFTVIVPMITGLVLYKRLPLPARSVTWLLIAWFITEICAYWLRVHTITNWNIYVVLTFVELVIVTRFYRSIFVSNKAKQVAAWLAWVGIAIVIAEYALMNSPASTISLFYESLFFIGMGLYAFGEFVTENNGDYMLMNATIMIMFMGSAVYFASWQFMKYDKQMFIMFAKAHAVLLIACYSLFTVALWRQ
jgi:hypothetical protein